MTSELLLLLSSGVPYTYITRIDYLCNIRVIEPPHLIRLPFFPVAQAESKNSQYSHFQLD
uniref:Uncharacterized protein n=2 Tax=Lepeophtheirus salmonis TaxID=72036 RepID=A0A0K2SVV0_LEPSM